MAPPPALVPSRVRVLIFDLDGTLVDSYRAITDSLNHARAHFRLPPLVEREVRPAVGWGLASLLERHLGSGRVEEGERLYRARYAEIAPASTVARPGAGETLRELHARGYALGVASNKALAFSEAILATLALRPYLGSVVGPERAGAPKPHPAMLRHCLEDLDARASEAAYVGDMQLDVETAARAGVSVILIPGGSSDVGPLRASGERVLDRLTELLGLLSPTAPAPLR